MAQFTPIYSASGLISPDARCFDDPSSPVTATVPPPAPYWELAFLPVFSNPSQLQGSEETLSPADHQVTLGPTWVIAPTSWDIYQEEDQWQAFMFQPTAEGSQELLPILDTEEKWVEGPVHGMNFFFHLQF